MEFLGHAEGNFYFTQSGTVISVNEETNAVSPVSNFSTISLTNDAAPSEVIEELAHASFTSLDIKVSSSKNRLYTVPKSVQNVANKALQTFSVEQAPPIAYETAQMLSEGGQIGLQQIQHLARYFSHHIEESSKAFASLWGGSSAERWVSAIANRENVDPTTYATSNSLELTDFVVLDGKEEEFSSFYIRLFADGSGFDRLYKSAPSGELSQWEEGVWYDIESLSASDSGVFYAPIDEESAISASAFLDNAPSSRIRVSMLNIDEATLAAEAVYDLDFSEIDSILAAGESAVPSQPTTDGVYTPEERSKNAEKQARDATGRFSEAGDRARYTKNQAISGTITNVDQATGNVTIKADNGQEYVVPSKDTLPEDAQHLYPKVPATALDTAGIFGEQAASTVQQRAVLPNTNPVLAPNDIFTLLSDWPTWIADQRASQKEVQVPQVKVEGPKDWLKVPNAYNDPHLRNWLDQKKTGADGKTTFPNRFWYRPMSPAYQTSVEKEKSHSSVYSVESVVAAGDVTTSLTPETSDVPPVYMAIVAPDDPQAVMDLICLIPANSASASPATFTYKNGNWSQDAHILADLKSPTPPPVVVLDNKQLESVVHQMEETSKDQKAAKESTFAVEDSLEPSVDELLAMALQYEAEEEALMAAGGLDRNRGNAEKLRHYWTVGEGGAKIRWGTGGDWTRCVRHLSKYLGPRAKGYCALRHKEMTGLWTGDKTHRALYGQKGHGHFAMSDEMLLSTEEIINKAALRAQAEELKNRVLLASGGFEAPAETVDGSKFKIPLVVPEGIETGDGRKFSAGAITLRELPLPLMWQIKTAEGHNGSVVVGRIDHMERIDGGIGNAYGVFDSGEYGREAERLVRGGFIRGISADLDRFEASEEPEENSSSDKKKIGAGKITINKARVMGVTLVPKPAFQECTIELTEEPTTMELAEQDALVACASVVAAIPVVPPHSWFDNPNLSVPTPLTVTDDGRVFGHIAAWHVDHIGLSFGTKPPRSRSGYAYFHTGIIRTDDGADVPVGQLTLAGGHAPLNADARSAAKHYDDTASAFADVHAGEDAHGIWVSGALRPSITPEQVRAIRASAPSGDWRPIMGSLELVAVCQVNVPGFPIARARVASGEVYALVAAGASYLARIKEDPSVLQAAEDVKARFAAIRSEMETNTTITAGVSMEEMRQEPLTVTLLNQLLADVVDFYHRAHGFHWNVTGDDFAMYHKLFGDIYDDVYGSIDDMAENVRKLGGFPPFELDEFMSLSGLPRVTVEAGNPKSMVADLLLANEVVIQKMKDIYHVYDEANEQAICNFLAGRMDMHQKWQWQLASSVTPEDFIISEDEDMMGLMPEVFSTLEKSGIIASALMYTDFAAFTEEQRKELAKKGEALPDGSYPIRNVSDLKNAIHAYGRSKPADRAKVRAHIRKRAKALGHPEMIPDTFASEALELSAEVDALRARINAASITAAAAAKVEEDPKN